MNIKKIVSLSSALVLLVFSFVFGTDNKSLSAGAGNGTSESFEEVSDISDVINNLPSSNVYYEGLEDEISEDFKSVTYVEISNIRNTQSYGSTEIYDYIDRTLTICYTREGAYYHNVGTQTQGSDKSDSNGNVIEENQVIITFDYELYLASDSISVKYNRWEYVQKENNEVVELDPMQAQLYDTIAANYGKWIDFAYDGPTFGEDYIPSTEEELKEYMKAMIVSEVSAMYTTQLITMNDANAQSLSKLGIYLGQHLDKFTENNGLYKLSDKEHFESVMGFRPENFNLNMTNKRFIEMDLKYYANNQSVTSIMYFKNLGNTEINVPKKTHMNIEELFADYIDFLMEEMGNE